MNFIRWGLAGLFVFGMLLPAFTILALIHWTLSLLSCDPQLDHLADRLFGDDDDDNDDNDLIAVHA